MSTEYQKMASDFMALWQKQVASAMSDKQFIHAMLEMFQSMQAPNEQKRAAATDADDAEPQLLAELAFRLAMCEKRLAALEGKRKPATGKRAKPGSKKPRK